MGIKTVPHPPYSPNLAEVVRTVQVHCSRRRLFRRGLEFHVCTINKSAHRKKKKNLETYVMILVKEKFEYF